MSEYIKREDAIKANENYVPYQRLGEDRQSYIDRVLKELPSADVVEVRHAYDMDEYVSLFECSNCGWTCDDTYCSEPCVGNTVTYNYCPNCGAKIDYKIGYGERKEQENE